ncbi:MAG TPA: choline dehydrogenase [Oscillatoriales cyanobacterium M59_W2019_021]|nr:choline dehydrogenase [Oscillatoriales cyanobacterium M4454_W2019_049]HIK49304.1 choline dehydrogenase [Oscillatoriales cyanobacterium M59_W2019_021]
MFDYIIVGAGSAGCVLANRLTENPDLSVLVLEAGQSDRSSAIHTPIAFSKLFKTEYDWAYETEPQPHLNHRRMYCPRGKVLGGSSSLNAMIYIRGHRSNYDRWAQLGNSGWSFAEILPYFKKAERQERGASYYHGSEGLLNVADLRDINPLSRVFVEAAVELGFGRQPDFNGAEPDGIGFYQVTQKNGRRHSAAAAYLKPCLGRSNLTVRTGTQVTRLLWEGTRVVGLEYRGENGIDRADVRREVILSAGAINSPQLLMLSGVGAAETLKSFEIPVVVDLPGVGQNLQDHLIACTMWDCTQPQTLDNANNFGNVLKYLLFKRGALTSNVAEAGGFVKTRSNLAVPDIQFHFVPAYFFNHGLTKRKGFGVTLGATLLYPESRGYVGLQSADPFAAPVVQPNYLSQEADLQTLMAGLNLARQIIKAAAFDRYRGAEVFPDSSVRTETQIVEYLRQTIESIYHPVGTCKMGNDSMAVVDSRLRVRGTQGLRVVDASIMPTIVGGNTNAPTIAIAEKAADSIWVDR